MRLLASALKPVSPLSALEERWRFIAKCRRNGCLKWPSPLFDCKYTTFFSLRNIFLKKVTQLISTLKIATSWKRIEEAITKNEPDKIAIEHNMCLTFARKGFHVLHYEDEKSEGSYDVVINNIRADLKRTKSTNNIIRYAKHALRVQNAEIILVEFEHWGNEFRDIVSEMSRKGFHGYYFVTGIEIIHSF